VFGAFNPADKHFYWKSAVKGNTDAFLAFLHQLRAQFKGKKLAVILDNASVHRSKKLRAFLEKYPDLNLFALPPYSPEYNPTEQVWHWIKPLVHGVMTIENGVEELMRRFRRVSSAWLNGRLAQPPSVGIGVWADLLVNNL
jgi:transposase